MDNVQLLAAFGQADWFRVAFNWDRDQIFDWMERASIGEVGGDSARKDVIQKYLKSTLSKIKDLSLPNGKRYHDPNVLPDSHFLHGIQVPPPGESQRLPPWHQGQGVQMLYWNPHDLLGYFLNLLGPAPPAATKSNFFLPLTAVYARWCAKIAGRAPPVYGYPADPHPGAGNWPFMYQCTWRDDPGRRDADKTAKKWFFLGASLGGGRLGRPAGRAVQDDRGPAPVPAAAHVRPDQARQRERLRSPAGARADPGWRQSDGVWELCGGLPLRGDDVWNRTLYGLALARDFMADPNLNAYDGLRGGVVWRNLRGPCRNCNLGIQEAPEN
ncbi:hypothetical protein PG999_009816 [Apiospora kogelbergensis]|uniref:Uncharacterized protein n=1 Tax=Apiospora kogelbergensis TaxID=1337665 RepID=A0AAW0QKD9_9PEZI